MPSPKLLQITFKIKSILRQFALVVIQEAMDPGTEHLLLALKIYISLTKVDIVFLRRLVDGFANGAKAFGAHVKDTGLASTPAMFEFCR